LRENESGVHQIEFRVWLILCHTRKPEFDVGQFLCLRLATRDLQLGLVDIRRDYPPPGAAIAAISKAKSPSPQPISRHAIPGRISTLSSRASVGGPHHAR
jgi:hypothetical protein